MAVGRLKEKYFMEAERYYLDFICRTTDIGMIRIEDDYTKEKEGEKILAKLPADTEMILLDVAGKRTSENDFVSIIKDAKNKDRSITFVIGGAEGFCDNIYKEAGQRISFSSLTFPHRLAKILLLDQLKQAIYGKAGH